jgi:putative oxidoreductase
MSDTNPRLIIPALGSLYDAAARFTWPILRIVTGLFLMPHGAQKLFGMFGGNPQAMAGFFSQIGIEPAALMVTLVGGVEFFGGLLLVLGLLTRPAAAAAFVVLLAAVLKVHLANGFFASNGGYEYPLMWAILAFAFVIRGGGECSIDRKIGKEF